MRFLAVRETAAGERRVALVPEVVGKLTEAGLAVAVERGAGAAAGFPDATYADAGAQVVDRSELAGADVVASVQPLPVADVEQLREGALTVGFLTPAGAADVVEECAKRRVTALSFDWMPRISRAQSMDALSSQALVAGYRCALVAADKLPRFFPLLMTAAGTVPPAKVLVLGAGVAGLQAIATARRLGAVVSAYDVRAAAAEEVKSLGAKFVDLDLDSLEAAGGYAKEMSTDRAGRQRELLAPHVAASDAVITTAAVPGRTAPLLVTTEMVGGMRPGSVVVDLAAETGGNCEASRPGEEVLVDGVLVWGARNMPSGMPADASRLYARNVVNVLLLMTRDGVVTPDFDDEVVAGAAVTHAGEVRSR